MLSPMKACGLPRNSDTSIWSSEMPGCWVRPAMRLSESPGRTRYCEPSSAGAVAAGRGKALAVARGGGAGRVTGAGAAALGAGAAAGAAAITGAVAGAGAAATLGGSNSIVYSRTRRPLDQLASTITSTKGSNTARVLVTRRKVRPSGRRTTCTWADGSTAL